MKALFIVLALSAANAQAADSLYCNSLHIADAGYSFTLADDQRTASLSEQSYVGNRPLANLNCEGVMHAMVYIPGRIYPAYVCKDELGGNGSYVVTIYGADEAGKLKATVNQQVFVNGRMLLKNLDHGNLSCFSDVR